MNKPGTKPTVSILIPTYNHEAYLGACLESVLAQTYGAWQAVVVDDASTDGTWALAQRYAARDSRIEVYTQTRRGLERLHETYNFALALAKGDLIAILEGDDVWLADKLERQVALHGDAMFSCGRTRIIGPAGERMTEFKPKTRPGSYSGAAFFAEIALRRAAVIPVSVLLSKAALFKLGGFVQTPAYPAVDVSTFAALLTRFPDEEVVFTDAILGCWRSHGENTTKRREAHIVSGVYEVALGGVRALPTSLQNDLDLSKKRIFAAHEPYLSGVYLGLLRQGLRARDRAQVFEFARRLWGLGTIKRRSQAVYGLVLFHLGLDMEHVFERVERFRRSSPVRSRG